MALTACGSSSSSSSSAKASGSAGGAVTLKLVAADYGNAGTSNSTQLYWQGIADDFHKAHPNITVNVQTIDWNDYSTKTTAMLQNKQYPDILEGDAPQQFASQGLLYPLTDVMSASTISNLIPVFAKQEQTNGTAYGAAFTTSTRVLYYNKKIFAEAKIAAAPTTWAELQADATKIKALGKGYIGYGLPLGTEEPQGESYMWMLGNGGGYVDSSGNYAINSAANVETFKFINGLVKAGVTEPSPATVKRQTMWDAFSAGQVGMVGGSGAVIPDIAGAKKLATSDYATAAFPGKTGPVTTPLGVHDDITAFKANNHAAQIKQFLDFAYSDKYQLQFDREYDLLPATTSAATALGAADPVQKAFIDNIATSVGYPTNANWNTVLLKLKSDLGTTVTEDPTKALGDLQAFAGKATS